MKPPEAALGLSMLLCVGASLSSAVILRGMGKIVCIVEQHWNVAVSFMAGAGFV